MKGEFVFTLNGLERLELQFGREILGPDFNIAGVVADGTVAGQVSQAAVTGPASSFEHLLI
jgi:hypothetical protein